MPKHIGGTARSVQRCQGLSRRRPRAVHHPVRRIRHHHAAHQPAALIHGPMHRVDRHRPLAPGASGSTGRPYWRWFLADNLASISVASMREAARRTTPWLSRWRCSSANRRAARSRRAKCSWKHRSVWWAGVGLSNRTPSKRRKISRSAGVASRAASTAGFDGPCRTCSSRVRSRTGPDTRAGRWEGDIGAVEHGFERRPTQQDRNPVQSDGAFDHGPGQILGRIVLAYPTLNRDRFCSFEQDPITSDRVAGKVLRRSLKFAWRAISLFTSGKSRDMLRRQRVSCSLHHWKTCRGRKWHCIAIKSRQKGERQSCADQVSTTHCCGREYGTS